MRRRSRGWVEGISVASLGAAWMLAFASLAFAGIAVRRAPDVGENHATSPPPCQEEIAGSGYDPGPPDRAVDVRTLPVSRGFQVSPSTRPSARGLRAARNVRLMDALHGRFTAIEYAETASPGDTRSPRTTPARSVEKSR